MAYQRPMVTVEQNISTAPITIGRDQPAFVFGPNYELHLYEDDSGRDGTMASKSYDGKPIEFRYPNCIDGGAVDRGYTKLYGENVLVKLVDLTPGAETADLPEVNVEKAQRDVNGGYVELLFPGKAFVNRDTEGNPVNRDASLPRNLIVGDTLSISYKENGDSSYTRIISKVSDVKFYASDFQLDSDSSHEGVSGTLVTIEDAIPETVDTSSVKVVLSHVFDGVEFTRKNEAKYVAGSTNPGYQWEQPVDAAGDPVLEDDAGKYFGIKVNELNMEVEGFFAKPGYCEVLSATLFVSFRELVKSYSDRIYSVTGTEKISSTLGKIHPDNPLAMGVYMAAKNAESGDGNEAPSTFFMAIPSDDSAGYDFVLDRASLTDSVYALAPTTRDKDVIAKVKKHCMDMSEKTVKQWRIAMVSAEVATEVARLKANSDGDDFLAIPVSDSGIEPGLLSYNKFRVVKGVDDPSGNSDTYFRAVLKKGDTVRFGFRKNAWEEYVYDTYTIVNVINNYTVEIEGEVANIDKLTPLDDNYRPSKIEIYHPLSADESAVEIANTSRQMASRRMYNIFPSEFYADGVKMTGEFAACAVAGIVSATAPQQPITNINVAGIDDVPQAYTEYNKYQLDTIAEGGTFIIAQDVKGGDVYIRHQISTAYSEGNINTAELSVTKNIDNISFVFADTFRPYYGKYNITPGLISILENLATNLIAYFSGDTNDYGPQLIAENTEILYVRQNEVMKDHVDMAIRMGVPYPCNVIEITFTV